MKHILDEPIILFCSERSGSNLITKIFDAHPDVCASGDSHLFKVMSECACKYPVGSAALRKAVLDLFHAKVSRWAIDAMPASEVAALLDGSDHAGDMVAALYATETKIAEKSYAFIKESSAFRYLQFVQSQCEKPRYLFMVRDPRDMALSWIHGPVMRGGVWRATERWIHDQAGYLAALPLLPPGTRISFLRYEDLLASPEEEVRRICHELDLQFSSEMMRFHDTSSSAKADARRSSMWSNLDKPLIADNAKKFLSGLSDDEIAYVEALAGSLMEPLGYASARSGKPAFGRFDTLEDLRRNIVEHEPYDKPAYQMLDIEERKRFECWSKLYHRMSALSPQAPAKLHMVTR